MFITTLKLVYKNMIWKRPPVGLWGLICMALLLTGNLYMELLKLGQVTAVFCSVLSLVCWFVLLPCFMTLIDLKQRPERMEAIWKMLHQ